MASEDLMLVCHRFADSSDHVGDVDAAPVHALDLLDDNERFIAVLIRNRERRAAVVAQCGVDVLHRPLDILRVVIDATDDHEFLDAPGDIELSSVIEKCEVAGPQPARRIAIGLRRKGLTGGNLVPPVAFRDMRTADPDLTDLVGAQPVKVFGIDYGDPLAHQRTPAADDDLRICLSGRRTYTAVA